LPRWASCSEASGVGSSGFCGSWRLMWGRLCLLRLRVLKWLLLQWHLAGTLCSIWRLLRGHLW
jgi:hypothetical protein